jgi:hypothetical protein
MDRTQILLPVLALTYYKLFREDENEEPEFVRLIARNYHNLLELPVLFYVACLLAYTADLVSPSLVNLAWVFVALRAVHTVIHISYNRISHRMPVFVTSSLILMGFWLVLGRALLD